MQQPDSRPSTDSVGRVVAALRAREVDALAVTWVDNAGLTRVKAVPVARIEHAARWGVGASPVFDTFCVDDSPVVGRYAGGPVGDLRLYPDLSRAVPLAAQPGWAWAPADRYDTAGLPHRQDARSLARAASTRLAEAGYLVRAAFEIEWVISTDAETFVPACGGPAYGMTRLTERSDYLREVLRALTAQGIVVEQIHPEYAAGQYEVSVASCDPVGAADDAVLVRETIRAVSLRRDLYPSFAPKVLADGVGNGGHVHLSVWRDDRNVMAGGSGPFELDLPGAAFIAGILDRLPALLAIGAPSVASYLRLVPSHWAGAYACWGLENREAALRVVTGSTGERGRAANIEVKCFDSAANPYLAMAALLAAGQHGIEARAVLPEPVDVDPATLGDAQLLARGVSALPGSLDVAVAAFEADEVLRGALGKELVDTVAAVRRGEIALFADADAEQICAATRWRY